MQNYCSKKISWNKCQSKVTIQAANTYFDYLIDPSFPGVNRLFTLSFENRTDRKVHTKHYFPAVELNDYNIMINGKKMLNKGVKNTLRMYDNVLKLVIGQGDGYTTSGLLDYIILKIL